MSDDEQSFAAWASARQHALLRSAYLLTLDNGRAEDLVQEALVKVATRWSRLRDQHPEAYARRLIYRDHVSLVATTPPRADHRRGPGAPRPRGH